MNNVSKLVDWVMDKVREEDKVREPKSHPINQSKINIPHNPNSKLTTIGAGTSGTTGSAAGSAAVEITADGRATPSLTSMIGARGGGLVRETIGATGIRPLLRRSIRPLRPTKGTLDIGGVVSPSPSCLGNFRLDELDGRFAGCVVLDQLRLRLPIGVCRQFEG